MATNTPSALAADIPRLQLGSLVACTGYRHPGLLAKMAVTIDDVSGGRLVLGVGAGDSRGELAVIERWCEEHGRDPASLVATTAVRCALRGSGYLPRLDERPLSGSRREMAETPAGHAKAGISEVQVALTMGGVGGVDAFARVIQALRE